MKKYLCLCAAILAMSVSLSYADQIEYVKLAFQQTLGVSADFTAGSGANIHWSGGRDGSLMTEYYDFAYFSTAQDMISADFTLMTDLSPSGGPAKASFADGDWAINVVVSGYGNVASIEGHIQGNYNEFATNPEGTALEGRAVAIVDSATFNNAYWQPIIGVPITWEAEGSAAGVIATITLPEGTPGIVNYQSDYFTPNVIVTIYADESVVPEPATMALLALGGLLLRKRS